MTQEYSEYSWKYGSSKVNFKLPAALVDGELTINAYPPLTDPVEAIKAALHKPIDAKPLAKIIKPGKTVAIIVNDSTRVANTHIFLPVLLSELNAGGLKDEDICIIFALGTHRNMSPEEMQTEVGSNVAARIKMYNSDCREQSQFRYMGETSRGTPVWFNKIVTDADHVICTGSVVHHFFAGFGGGRKALLPGVSAYETIRKNHSMMFDPAAVIGRLDDNPIYQDQVEGAAMCPPSFLLNVVLNEKKEFLKIFAGNYITAHRQACTFVNQVYGVEIEKRADLVIASCGGYPKDINVYQLQKTMDNAWCAVKDGGKVIILGECREGSGSSLYEKTMASCPSGAKVEASLRDNFQIGAHKAYAVTRLMKRAEFILVSALPPALASQLLFTPAQNMEEALAIALQSLGPNPRILLMPQGSLTVPRPLD